MNWTARTQQRWAQVFMHCIGEATTNKRYVWPSFLAYGRNVKKSIPFTNFLLMWLRPCKSWSQKSPSKDSSECLDFYNKVCWHSENGKILLFERWLFNNHVLFAYTLCFFLRGGHQRGKRGKREKTWETEAMKNVFRWRNHMLMLHFIPETAHLEVPTDSCEG